MHEHTDEQLVRAFQRGDEAAFGTFVARHRDRLYRLAVLWLHDAQHAEDVLQEALMRSYTGLGRFRFRAQPATWLIRVCRNVCREFNRSRRFEPLAPETVEALRFEPDFAGGLDGGARIAELRALVATLPERQRQALTLRVFEDLSVAETAHAMGCRPGTVKAHVNKAVTALRGQLNVAECAHD